MQPEAPTTTSSSSSPPSFIEKKVMVPLPREMPATIRDPIPCGGDPDELRACVFQPGARHAEVEQLILGDFAKLGLTNRYDALNQTSRYDVLEGMKTYSNIERQKPVLKVREAWKLPAGGVVWRTTPVPLTSWVDPANLAAVAPVAPVAPVVAPAVVPVTRVNSGLIYISSGRDAWFGKSGMTSPFVVWCLANNHHCDVVTDAAEFDKYVRAIVKPANLAALIKLVTDYGAAHNCNAIVLGADGMPSWAAQVAANLTVTAPQRKGDGDLQALPHGFGFNRWMGMTWMRARFSGICATMDDNSFQFAAGLSAPAMDWLFTANNITDKVASLNLKPAAKHAAANKRKGEKQHNWLSLAFAPCTLAVEARQSAEDLRGAAAAPIVAASAIAAPAAVYTGNGIEFNDPLVKPNIVQQLTLWNAACYAGQKEEVNYDSTFVTGKEDVEFFRRLTHDPATKHLMFREKNLHIVKCSSKGTPNTVKERAITNALYAVVSNLSPCFLRVIATKDEKTFLKIAKRFYGPGAESPEAWSDKNIAALLRRINTALEQLLVSDIT